MNAPSYRESHQNKGADYHETFRLMPFRATIWGLEQRLLLRIMREYFPGGPPTYLDFACGTGRILGLLSPYSASALGVDVSASMLSVARRSGMPAQFVQLDITRDDKLGDRRFDLITAFRFFANAESELREAALSTLATHLSPTGVLVFNNHKNAGSLRNRLGSAIRRIQRRPRQHPGAMSDDEARALVTHAGLRVHQVHHSAVLPFSDNTSWLPKATITSMELALSALPATQCIARNLVYICRHAN